jgi:hypothetical protein
MEKFISIDEQTIGFKGITKKNELVSSVMCFAAMVTLTLSLCTTCWLQSTTSTKVYCHYMLTVSF